ncbi:MAG: DUF4160 domain-containing protein [Prevotella sp.]|nr:DUF4160 domain-containing protein [Prevotella sp.]MBP3845221.1 DUF4160 domain-containing protein [Prevotella sp.]
MIDIRKLKFNGKLNYQNGLSFYYKDHGRFISFYIDDIRVRRRKIKVTMQPDPNHGRAHVHLDNREYHDASFAVDTGEMLEGNCDRETQGIVKDWIRKHRRDLQQLWNTTKAGGRHEPIVDKIRRNKDFEDFGFKGEEPEILTEIRGVKIWHNGDLIYEEDEGRLKVIGEDNIYVGLPFDFEEGSITFESIDGEVQEKRIK